MEYGKIESSEKTQLTDTEAIRYRYQSDCRDNLVKNQTQQVSM